MGLLFGLFILFCIFVLPNLITDYKFSNNLPPEGYRTDHAAINRDLAMGKSKNEVMRKSNRGEYYIKK